MITQALLKLRPGASWSLNSSHEIQWEEVLDEEGLPTGRQRPVNLLWLDREQTCPTREEIDAEVAVLEAAWAATEYQRQREPAYPKIEEFADAYYWAQKGDNTKMDAYVAKIDAVKEQFPKG